MFEYCSDSKMVLVYEQVPVLSIYSSQTFLLASRALECRNHFLRLQAAT